MPARFLGLNGLQLGPYEELCYLRRLYPSTWCAFTEFKSFGSAFSYKHRLQLGICGHCQNRNEIHRSCSRVWTCCVMFLNVIFIWAAGLPEDSHSWVVNCPGASSGSSPHCARDDNACSFLQLTPTLTHSHAQPRQIAALSSLLHDPSRTSAKIEWIANPKWSRSMRILIERTCTRMYASGSCHGY